MMEQVTKAISYLIQPAGRTTSYLIGVSSAPSFIPEIKGDEDIEVRHEKTAKFFPLGIL